ncbi:PREDICTED: ninja-family protein AFP4-like [Camelina sativa]|uniref:Ninja-family protein n=1 Tax=Camelina sativa TaxID=90675 RepID=A0ABM0VZI5_CAMSA|nr:PREDICTED: ninja-family protein AFP4-like [Camelina sativa]
MEMIRRGGGIPNGVVQVPNLAANNLLHKYFISSNYLCQTTDSDDQKQESNKKEVQEEEEEKDVELTLGLSLNGQFGTDPRSRKRKNFELGRSSSIPQGFIFVDELRRSGGGDMQRGAKDMFQLDRTRSLPVVTEIETERKRMRSEKTRTVMESPVHPLTKDKNRTAETEEQKARAILGFKIPPTKEKEEKDRFVVPGSVNEGKGKNARKKNVQVSGMEKARNILEDMPCVSTRDVGADGKRVEGFLYWYGGNKEEVKIVCVCHGSFLSPAEFVRHGGCTVSDDNSGGDVAINPLRHIVVKLPSSSSL